MVLKKSKKSHLDKNMFLDEAVDIQRFDVVKYPVIEKLTDKFTDKLSSSNPNLNLK